MVESSLAIPFWFSVLGSGGVSLFALQFTKKEDKTT